MFNFEKIKMAEVRKDSNKVEIRKIIENEKKINPSKVVKALVDSTFLATDFHPELAIPDVLELYKNNKIEIGGKY